MPAKPEVYQAVEDREDELVAFMREFVAIDTENPPGRNYREAASFLEDELTDRGYGVDLVEVPRSVVAEQYPDLTDHDRINVVARTGERPEGPHIHFTGHFDVVPAGEDWTIDPYDPVRKDERLYGRGTSDMKSGIAASLFAIDALEAADVPLEGTITQSMTVDEETGGFTGLGYLVDQGHVNPDNTDYCVYTECFDSSRVCLGHRGVLKFHVTADGEKAHGCMAHDGRNAVMAMNELLTLMSGYEDRLHDRRTDLPVVPPESRRSDIAATMIEAGYSENVVPDRCRATFYRVLIPGEDVENVRSEIRSLLTDAELATGHTFDYEEIMYAEPTSVPKDGTVSKAYMDNIRRFHDDPSFVVSPGSDDQRFVVNDAGIEECIVYGPGQLDQAHVADEFVSIEEILTAAKVMAASTMDLLGTAE